MKNFISQYKIYIIILLVSIFGGSLAFGVINANKDQTKEYLTYRSELKTKMNAFYYPKFYNIARDIDKRNPREYTAQEKEEFINFFSQIKKENEKIDCNKVENTYFDQCQKIKTIVNNSTERIEKDSLQTGYVTKDLRDILN